MPMRTDSDATEHLHRACSLRACDECKACQEARHALMAVRARQAGVVLEPDRNAVYERLRARGRLQ